MQRPLLFLSILLSLTPKNALWAIDIREAPFLSTSRIATYIGTFSPPHKRHEEIVEGVLNSGNADFVVVIANDLTFHKPDAISAEHRVNMLWNLYKDNPRVLVVRDINSFAAPMSRSVSEFLMSKIPQKNLYGIMGYDSAESFRTRTAARFSKRDKWLVTSAAPLETINVRPSIAGKSAEYIHVPDTVGDVRSSQMRREIMAGKFDNLPLSQPVIDYIKRTGLYSRPVAPPSKVQLIRSCVLGLRLLLK